MPPMKRYAYCLLYPIRAKKKRVQQMAGKTVEPSKWRVDFIFNGSNTSEKMLAMLVSCIQSKLGA